MGLYFPARRRRRLLRRARRGLGIVRKLTGLSPAELVELLRAQVALLSAQLLVWTRPVGRFVTHSSTDAEPDIVGAVEPGAARIALAVSRAAAYGVFRPLCLVRAVALNRMLDARGFRGSRVRIGVRRERGQFAAHAWVEYKHQVLGDVERHVNTFAPLTDVQLLRKA